MPTIQLADGHTAELRDVGEVRRSDVRYAAQAADRELNVTGNGQGDMQASGVMLTTAAMQDAIIVRFVTSWTLTADDGAPLPVTLEVVQDLPLRFYKPLAAATVPALKEVLSGGDTNGAAPDPLSVGRSSR